MSALEEAAMAQLELAMVDDLTTGGFGFRHGGDTASGGDAALSCMKSSSSSCPTALLSCGEWIHGLRFGEVLM